MSDDLATLRESFYSLLAAQRRLRGRDAVQKGELSFAQYRLLRRLAEAPEGLPAGRLAVLAEVSSATITQMLDGLEKAGIAQRTRDGDDRRVVVVALTPEGRRLQACKEDELRRRWEAAFADAGEDELRIGRDVLMRLAGFYDEL
ncbi:MAG: transcriptional regulator, MarR family [Solirubrobacterales bacterium]|nr:transcriptional regulator, MarR family [Solirubrobacterales bacterium]